MRRSFSAAGSGVGNMACTLMKKFNKISKYNLLYHARTRLSTNTAVLLLHLQFMHQMGAQVLSDVFMPGLP